MQESKQVKITTGLRIMKQLDRSLVNYPVMKDPFVERVSAETGADTITQSIENWISLYLSPTDQPDVGTASCLSLQATGITLYVANGKLKESENDKRKLKEFVTMTDDLLKAKAAKKTEIEMSDIVEHSLARNCWQRIWERISNIQSVLTHSGAQIPSSGAASNLSLKLNLGRVDKLLDAWVAHRQAAGKDVDTSEDIADFTKRTKISPRDAIRGLLGDLLNIEAPTSTKPGDLDTVRVQCYSKAISACQKLDLADFFVCSVLEEKDYAWWRALTTDDSLLLRELYRSLQAVYEYHVGADLYTKAGMKLLQRVNDIGTRPITELFSIVWVSEKLTYKSAPRYTWPSKSPADFINEKMNRYRHRVEIPTHKAAEIHEEWSRLWTPGTAITGLKVHPAIQMSAYLKHHGIEPLNHVVGLSIPPCFACGNFLRISRWKYREESHKVQDDWLTPSEGIEEATESWEHNGCGLVFSYTVSGTANVVDAFLVDKLNSTRVGLQKARYSVKEKPLASNEAGTISQEDWMLRFL